MNRTAYLRQSALDFLISRVERAITYPDGTQVWRLHPDYIGLDPDAVDALNDGGWAVQVGAHDLTLRPVDMVKRMLAEDEARMWDDGNYDWCWVA